MIRTVGGLLALVALAPALQAQSRQALVLQQYRAILEEHKQALVDFNKALAASKTPQEREEVIREKFSKTDEIAARSLKLAQQNPRSALYWDMMMWTAANGSLANDSADSPRLKALALLTRNFARSGKIAALLEQNTLLYAWDDANDKLLREIMAKNLQRAVRGKACLLFAQQAEKRLELAEQSREPGRSRMHVESLLGKKSVDALVKADLDKLSKEAETRYQRLAKDYGKLPSGGQIGTMAQLAEAKMDSLRFAIRIGKEAPDIVGEDIDGKKFKLSDYRGKVVLLDFWGNW